MLPLPPEHHTRFHQELAAADSVCAAPSSLLCSVLSSFFLAVPQTAGQDPEDMTGTDSEMFMLPLPAEHHINRHKGTCCC
jgi:hypothetical protein